MYFLNQNNNMFNSHIKSNNTKPKLNVKDDMLPLYIRPIWYDYFTNANLVCIRPDYNVNEDISEQYDIDAMQQGYLRDGLYDIVSPNCSYGIYKNVWFEIFTTNEYGQHMHIGYITGYQINGEKIREYSYNKDLIKDIFCNSSHILASYYNTFLDTITESTYLINSITLTKQYNTPAVLKTCIKMLETVIGTCSDVSIVTRITATDEKTEAYDYTVDEEGSTWIKNKSLTESYIGFSTITNNSDNSNAVSKFYAYQIIYKYETEKESLPQIDKENMILSNKQVETETEVSSNHSTANAASVKSSPVIHDVPRNEEKSSATINNECNDIVENDVDESELLILDDEDYDQPMFSSEEEEDEEVVSEEVLSPLVASNEKPHVKPYVKIVNPQKQSSNGNERNHRNNNKQNNNKNKKTLGILDR